MGPSFARVWVRPSHLRLRHPLLSPAVAERQYPPSCAPDAWDAVTMLGNRRTKRACAPAQTLLSCLVRGMHACIPASSTAGSSSSR